jgi:hypothetical protein
MKNMDAMIIATVRDWARTGYVPERDSVLAFFAIIIGTWSGMGSADFSAGAWPSVTLMPLFGLPVGFVLIIALLIVSTRRRRGAGDHGSAEYVKASGLGASTSIMRAGSSRPVPQRGPARRAHDAASADAGEEQEGIPRRSRFGRRARHDLR